MKEIKFRAWDQRSGRMYNNLAYVTMRGGAMSSDPDIPLINPILMQFTGLKDSQGKEIYEGDIVRMKSAWEGTGEVIYEPGGFEIKGKTSDGYPVRVYVEKSFVAICEVIGNIWDNPDLLKEAP